MSVDLRRLTDWCSAYENSSIDDTTPPAIAVVPDFTSKRSPGSDHFTDVVVQSPRCRLSRPPRVSTDVTQRRRDDNLQVIWRASLRVLCSKLHYLRLCRPKITSIEVSKVSRSPTWLQTISQHQRFKFPISVAISVQTPTVNCHSCNK